MQGGTTLVSRVDVRRNVVKRPQTVAPNATTGALWMTSSTLTFDQSWCIDYSSHSTDASPTILALECQGTPLLDLLGKLSHRFHDLKPDVITEKKGPFTLQFGLWDQDAYRNYRVHIFANAAGGLCRIETRVPQPDRITEATGRQAPLSRSLENAANDPSCESRAWIQALDELWPAVAFLQDGDGTVTEASESIFQFTGRGPEDFQSNSQLYWEVIHDSDRFDQKNWSIKATHERETASRRFRIRHQDTGRVRYVMEYRRPCRNGLHECVWMDVSRETIAEKRLSTAAWKETLGVLTVGLAHDFSNILAGIISLSETFLTQLQNGESIEADGEVGMKLIKTNAQQATQLVQRIVHLHKGEAIERTYQDLNDVVTEVSQLINKVLPRHIEVQLQRGQDELPIYVDLVELRQVLINLALNAADAMPLGGWIRLSTRRLTELPLYQQLVGTIPSSSVVALEISDCGHGIEAQHLETIFDPFFTTKYHNKGSGLGLYNSRRFIEKQGGAIGVTTRLNEGTTFTILMPEATFTEAEQEFEAERMHQHVVIAGEHRDEIQAMSDTLKAQEEFRIVSAQFEDDILGQIESAYHQQVGVVLLAHSQEQMPLGLVPRIKRSFPKAKILLVISGSNPDEIPPNIARQADRSICADAPPSELAHELAELFRL